MTISMIAAMSSNRVIGKNNDIPWHLPDDFSYFKETTREHVVLMGRKNFESLPDKFRPLPHRTNVIITRKRKYTADRAIVVHSLADGLDLARQKGEEEVFIIGGGEIYNLGLEVADKIYLTEINAQIDGEVYFPEFDKTTWQETSRKHHPADNRHKFDFDFVIYQKKQAHGLT